MRTWRLRVWGAVLVATLAQTPTAIAAGGPGTVYLVLGSDADAWNYGITPGNYGTTVDVYVPHPYYPPGLFTDPGGPAYQVTDPAFRNKFQDSFGQGLKFTWWMMGGNIFRSAVNANVPLPNTMNVYLMKKYHGAALRQYGDELTLHYHTFLWSDYDGDGISYWNQSRTFEECREDFELTVAQYLLEEEVFAATFRSGWHFMDNDWQQRLDELLPFSLHDDWPAYKAWALPEPVSNVQDWRMAPSAFVPFHPATTNYQVAGDGRGWNVRSVKMQNLTQSILNQLFAAASNGVDQVACFWDHLPENFVSNVNRVGPMIQLAASSAPTVPFRFCTAVEAMQRWLGAWNLPPPQLEVTEEVQGETVTLHVQTSGPIFQPQPYVALKDIYAQYSVLSCSNTGPNAWAVTLPAPRDSLAKVGVAVTDPVGNVATQLLRYLPDDLFLDTIDPSYAEISGNWVSTTNAAWGTNARIALLSGPDVAQAQWTLPLTWSGRYELYAQVPAVSDAASDVLFEVVSGGATIFSVANSRPWPAGQWVYLGAPVLDATLSNSVTLVVAGSNQPGTYALANVIKLSPLRLAQSGFINQVAVNPFDTTANITWTTLNPATTLVEYGPTPAYGGYTMTNSTLLRQHVMTLTGLGPGTTNYFQIDSVDTNGVVYTYQGEFTTADFSRSAGSGLIFDLTNVWKFSTNNLDGVPWKAPGYADSDWPEGPALLWVDTRQGGPNPAVHFRNTPMPANPATQMPYITYYFRTHFTFTNEAARTVLVFSNYIDDGALFCLNGVEIQRNNLPLAPVAIKNSTLAKAYNCSGDATCLVVFSVSGSLLTNLVQGDNVLAVEVHNYVTNSPDITFGSALLFEQRLIPPPRLSCLFSAPFLTLYWNGTGCTLQQTAELSESGSSWTDVPGPVTRSPYAVTNSNAGTLFYRLRQ